jgi:Myc proto-oncogene protein
MLNELILLAYGEDILTSNPVSSPPITMPTNLQDNLIQDCMWSVHVCDRTSHSKRAPPAPLNLAPVKISGEEDGVYTPAPSPPPPPSSSGSESGPEEAMESDCISPSAVFPSLLTPPANKSLGLCKSDRMSAAIEAGIAAITEKTSPVTSALRSSNSDPDWEYDKSEGARRQCYERSQRRRRERKLSTAAVGTGANCRHQPHSECSTSCTSDEEIDVVTVPSSERTKVTRKRPHPLSAPCSRQPSPHSPTKRKKYHTKRLQRLSSAGSSGCDFVESDDEARRASHNVLERKRRNDLKSSFQRLREEIPELEDNQRAPKVTILRKAMDFIRHMQDIERATEAELVAEKQRKAQLLDRLNKLRSSRV